MKKDKMVTVTIDGAKFTVELPESKIAEIFGKNYGKVELGTIKEGETFSTGKYEWVVLEQTGSETLVLLKDVLPDYRRFDENSNNWVTSELRKWLNTEFLKELDKEIGEENLVGIQPDLSTDDGTDGYKWDNAKDKVSLLSCDDYREYRKFIPKTESWYWTLTPVSSEEWTSFVRYVFSYGALDYDDCYDRYGGVRPFCILKSEILVSKGE